MARRGPARIPPPLDVLHITHQFAPETRGGVESHVHDLVLAQRAAGLDARVLTGSFTPWSQVGIEALDVDGIPVTRLHRDDLYFDLHSKAWHPGVGELLAVEFAREKPRVVHVHHWLRLTSNLVEIARRAHAAVVVTLHDHWTSCPRAFRIRKDDAACTRALSPSSCGDCVPRFGHESRAEIDEGIALFAAQNAAELAQAQVVIVATDSLGDRLATTTGVPRPTYRTLGLGHAPRFAGLPPLEAPIAAAPFRFACWGALAEHKGIDVLVDAFRRLCAAHPARAELHLLGAFSTADYETRVRRAAEGLPITFHGAFTPPDVHRIAPHAGVFPSTCFETWGIVLDECFELGLPCVVSDRGALPERVGNAGLVARAGAADDLAAKMAMLLDVGTWTNLRSYVVRPTTSTERYCGELEWIYEEAHARAADEDRGAAPRPTPLPEARRLRFLLRQRESALSRVVPEGGPR